MKLTPEQDRTLSSLRGLYGRSAPHVYVIRGLAGYAKIRVTLPDESVYFIVCPSGTVLRTWVERPLWGENNALWRS